MIRTRLLSMVKNDIVLILAGTAIGLTALIAVYLLPIGLIQSHVYWSMEMIRKEFEDEVTVTGYSATLTGNFTDCLMLEHAAYRPQNHSILEQVLYMYRGETYPEGDGWWPGHSLNDYLLGITQPREVEYARYWHGYLVVLKPLLWLTSFNTIRLFNSAIQLFLAGCVVMGLCRRNESGLTKGFLLSLPFLFFVSSYASLSLSICLYLMLAAVIVQLKMDFLLIKRNWYGYFFLIVGMATSYFDFLTYPLVTLVFPLCIYLYLNETGGKHTICRMIGCSAKWLEGYIGLWMMKWVLTDILVGGSVIRDAAETLMVRTNSAEGYSRIAGFFSVLQKNIQPYSNWCYVLLGGIGGVLLTAGFIRHGVRRENLFKIVPYVLLALYPFGWFFVAQNHSEQHWQYTCRIMACSVFALYAGCLKIQDQNHI